MTFQQGISGNPHGNRHRTRHLLNQEFMQALLLNFRHEGKKAIEKVARNQPAAYLKILALLVPREMKLDHSGGVKAMIAARDAGASAKVVEEVPEPIPALPASSRKARRKARRTEGQMGADMGKPDETGNS